MKWMPRVSKQWLSYKMVQVWAKWGTQKLHGWIVGKPMVNAVNHAQVYPTWPFEGINYPKSRRSGDHRGGIGSIHFGFPQLGFHRDEIAWNTNWKIMLPTCHYSYTNIPRIITHVYDLYIYMYIHITLYILLYLYIHPEVVRVWNSQTHCNFSDDSNFHVQYKRNITS